MVFLKNPAKCRQAVSHLHDGLKATVSETAVSTPSLWWWRCWHLESSSVKTLCVTASDLASYNFTLSYILILDVRWFWGAGAFISLSKTPQYMNLSSSSSGQITAANNVCTINCNIYYFPSYRITYMDSYRMRFFGWNFVGVSHFSWAYDIPAIFVPILASWWLLCLLPDSSLPWKWRQRFPRKFVI
jgi:hypothetical protein